MSKGDVVKVIMLGQLPGNAFHLSLQYILHQVSRHTDTDC